jgi:hypothetical protein
MTLAKLIGTGPYDYAFDTFMLAFLATMWWDIRHGTIRDARCWTTLVQGLCDIGSGIVLWLHHGWSSPPSVILSAWLGITGCFLVWKWWKGNKPRRDKAAKLIGDKSRQILAAMQRALREAGQPRSPVPGPA